MTASMKNFVPPSLNKILQLQITYRNKSKYLVIISDSNLS